MMKSINNLIGRDLDYAVAVAEGRDLDISGGYDPLGNYYEPFEPSTNWSQAGPIIERESISIIRLDNKSIPDSNGFWQGKYISRWAAVIGDQHSMSHVYGPQGDDYGDCYEVEATAIVGETPLITAMRCYVVSKLGKEIEIPEGV